MAPKLVLKKGRLPRGAPGAQNGPRHEPQNGSMDLKWFQNDSKSGPEALLEPKMEPQMDPWTLKWIQNASKSGPEARFPVRVASRSPRNGITMAIWAGRRDSRRDYNNILGWTNNIFDNKAAQGQIPDVESKLRGSQGARLAPDTSRERQKSKVASKAARDQSGKAKKVLKNNILI